MIIRQHVFIDVSYHHQQVIVFQELDSTWEDLQVALGRKKLSVAKLLSAREALQQEQTSATEIYRLLGEIRKRTCTAKVKVYTYVDLWLMCLEAHENAIEGLVS